MDVKKEYPPNIEEIKKHFPVRSTTVFTYGDCLYNPGGWDIPRDLMIHEETHMRQQGDNPEEWWDRYFKDTEFRLDQEIKAYRNQWKYVLRSNEKNKSIHLTRFAKDLSSELYGNIINYHEASRKIARI